MPQAIETFLGEDIESLVVILYNRKNEKSCYAIFLSVHYSDHFETLHNYLKNMIPNYDGDSSYQAMFFDNEEDAYATMEIFNSHPLYSSDFYAKLYSPDGKCVDENT